MTNSEKISCAVLSLFSVCQNKNADLKGIRFGFFENEISTAFDDTLILHTDALYPLI